MVGGEEKEEVIRHQPQFSETKNTRKAKTLNLTHSL
jgi:hypothetical protein